MNHLMIDIETIDVNPTAVILSIGAQGFDPFSTQFSQDTYYERFTMESQDDRTIDDSTIKWWSEQSQSAQDEAFGEGGQPRITLEDGLTKLSKMIWKNNTIWANGISFDMPIIEHALKQHEMSVPWKYWQVMDTRTIYRLVPEIGKLGNNHNALADCVNQIDLLQKALKILNIKKI